MDSTERLVRIRQLLAGLPGPYGNGQLWTVIRHADTSDPFPDAFALLTGVGVLDAGGPNGMPPQAPQDAAQLSARMSEASQEVALAVLIGMSSRTLAYGAPGRYPEERARDVFRTLVKLLGHGTRWWTNTDLVSWDPVTRHVMDALVIGMGCGVMLAVLATDED
ncbi:hypothetical protein Q3W71_20470 [Micromonospora sp. C28SCA-DRY-2]|uniref:hypothetical protein n=1 Tax=Micromonospora sp. C28SCA-DRY-2 TaxID=3059522 RepID=UPI0026758E0D|nr:hypothetical protein [Micromonospora sp. C28SCA-DRY-2]MDO3704045.1 hypothetical protein [Micromonospora sp. C28SCA-DRY-2]